MSERSYVFLFPGQGSQSARMGEDFHAAYPAARAVFERADELLGRDLSALIFAGPMKEVERTATLQPAIAAVNAAVLAVLEEHGVAPSATAGHSLGEYSAVHAAGAVSFEKLMGLVSRRGRLMDEAASARPGGMVSVIGLDEAGLRPVVDQAAAAGVVCVANLNSPEQVVLSGEQAALEEAARLAVAAGAKRIVYLPVSGAWHSPLMGAASESFEEVLSEVDFDDARISVYCNVSARPTRQASELRTLLARQILAPVRWEESMRAMIDDHPDSTFVEVGPGRVLMGLALRIDRRCRVVNVDSVRALEKFLSKI